MDKRISRRQFVGATAAGLFGVALPGGSISSLNVLSDSSNSGEESMRTSALPTLEDCFKQYDPIYYAKQARSAEYYHSMISSFGSNDTGGIKYPEYYGGAFIDDSGTLIVFVKDIEVQKSGIIDDIRQALGTDDFSILSAEYSKIELDNTMDFLNCLLIERNNNEGIGNWTGHYIADKENHIVVNLIDTSRTQIESFKRLVKDSCGAMLDAGIITFDQSDRDIHFISDMKPGSFVTSYLRNASIGYRAKRSGKAGLVIAGHLGSSYGMPMYLENESIPFGYVTATGYGGLVDAAFVEFSNQLLYTLFPPSNVIAGTSYTLLTSTEQPPTGAVVTKSGITSGVTSGPILNTSVTNTVDGVLMVNMTEANLYAWKGDSGGIVFRVQAPNINPYTLGTLVSSNSVNVYYAKADVINSMLVTTRY